MKQLGTTRTVINIFLSLVFILFAIVQLNDPDPIIWFSIYLLTAVLCAVSIFRKIPLVLLYGFGLILLFYAAMHLEFAIEWILSEDKRELFDEMQKDKYYLEGTREFLGLLIALAALVFLIKQQKTHSQ
ncbi:MAG: transmembrane 220 family protein [Lutimonas sp.]